MSTMTSSFQPFEVWPLLDCIQKASPGWVDCVGAFAFSFLGLQLQSNIIGNRVDLENVHAISSILVFSMVHAEP